MIQFDMLDAEFLDEVETAASREPVRDMRMMPRLELRLLTVAESEAERRFLGR